MFRWFLFASRKSASTCFSLFHGFQRCYWRVLPQRRWSAAWWARTPPRYVHGMNVTRSCTGWRSGSRWPSTAASGEWCVASWKWRSTWRRAADSLRPACIQEIVCTLAWYGFVEITITNPERHLNCDFVGGSNLLCHKLHGIVEDFSKEEMTSINRGHMERNAR